VWVNISHERKAIQQFGLHNLFTFVNFLYLVQNVLPVCLHLNHLADKVSVGESTVFEVLVFLLLEGEFYFIQFLFIVFYLIQQLIEFFSFGFNLLTYYLAILSLFFLNIFLFLNTLFNILQLVLMLL
jgi:hypothetical protein